MLRFATVWTAAALGAVASMGQVPKALASPEVAVDGKVTFRLAATKATKASVNSGEMQPVLKTGSTPMVKGGDGVWTATVGPLPPGIYDYTFNIDGVSITDPLSPHVFGNRRGSRGYVEVPGAPGKPRHDEWRPVPHGTVAIHWYDSAASGSRRRVHVYTPPGYAKDDRKLPVLYLLHGSGDNDSHWMHIGRANVVADNLLADGKAQPMIIVMPDGHVRERPPGAVDEKTRMEIRAAFEKDLFEHVIPLVESSYRVRTDAAGRAIAGLSMGSAQSLTVGLSHTDRFAWIGAFSGAVGKDDPAVTGLTVEATGRLKLLWLAIGKDDTGLARKRELSAALKEKNVAHEYRETDGAHRWSVWRLYLSEFLPRLFHP